MENATKALLIAAAVLIAIVLVAFGVNLLGSMGDSGDQAGNVANEISTGINHQAGQVIDGLKNFGPPTTP